MRFEKSFVINLAFKTERLVKFQSSSPSCLAPVEVWRAIHGDTVQHPDWWTAGRGAWGCYRSHLQILEKCYNEATESYLVFEDDAVFRDGFEQEYSRFIVNLPDDWEMAYLGGQLLHEIAHPPKQVNEHCYIPYNVNRTHAFAVHQRGYAKLYRHLSTVPFVNAEHIDHHLGRLHESGRIKVYCPAKWLVGQDAGPSNISGNVNGISFWVDPERLARPGWITEKPKTVFLEAPLEVAIEMRLRGWHQGHWRNEQQLDCGVCGALVSRNTAAVMAQWYQYVATECVREGHKGVCLYHPALTWETVRAFPFATFTRITVQSLAEAEAVFAGLDKSAASQNAPAESQKLPNVPTEPDPADSSKRHLCYHVWPRKGQGTWRRNVEQLLKRIDQFDGIRSIGIVTDAESETLATVQAAFEGHRIDHWVTFPNNEDLGPAVTFAPLLQTVSRESGATFYGHADGVHQSSGNHADQWEEALYKISLDNPAQILASLESHPITGACKLPVKSADRSRNEFQYLGSFFWFRNEDVFGRRSWHEINPTCRGVDIWPGRLFTVDECGSLFTHDFEELEQESAWEQIQSKLTAC